MDLYSGYINQLIEQFASLPGIGNKSAQRLAFHMVNMPKEQVERFAKTVVDARNNVCYCKICCTLTDQEICPICSNPKRDHSTIMVVENTRDLAAYEKTGKFDGVYHVLHGAISPMLGIGPSDIRLKELITRLQTDEVKEVIVATNSSLEGETTAMYISKLIKPTGIKVTRIASGVPVGGDLEYIASAYDMSGGRVKRIVATSNEGTYSALVTKSVSGKAVRSAVKRADATVRGRKYQSEIAMWRAVNKAYTSEFAKIGIEISYEKQPKKSGLLVTQKTGTYA